MFIVKCIHLIYIYSTGCKIGHIYIDLVYTHAGKAFHYASHIAIDQTYQDNDRCHTDDDA